jgi:methylmalonyl-CoA mutase N-terminal domain/subunit
MRLVGDTIEFCAKHVPHYSPVSVCGYHIRESGATPVQEMAYGLSIAKAYIDHVKHRGLSVDDFAGGLSFNFNIHGNIWEQVAKFRAGRRLWAKILKNEYGATSPRSMQLRMIAGGGGGGLTIQQPENNIVRGAYYALISALSGTQTMALCSYDEAYTIPSEHAARLSLRTMQILMHEMGLCDTVDPLGGSYFIETMTNEMESHIVKAMAEVAAQGGIVRAISDGRVQAAVNRQAYERERKIQSGEIPKVGVNCFVEEEAERPVELHPYRDEEARRQVERLRAIRERRNEGSVFASLDALRRDAQAGKNVMPATMNAVKQCASVGEICNVLREVFGSYREPVRF